MVWSYLPRLCKPALRRGRGDDRHAAEHPAGGHETRRCQRGASMSAVSPEDTLTVERPRAEASTTTPRPWFISLVWLLLVAEFSRAIAGVALAMAGVFSL